LDFLPMIQYIRCSISPNCLHLLWVCDFHVSRRSRCIPRYLTIVSWRMIFPLRCTAGHSSLPSLKVMCVDFDSFARMRHLFSHCSIWCRCSWRCWVAVMGSVCDANIAVSSA
jgi:hypothetical protein